MIDIPIETGSGRRRLFPRPEPKPIDLNWLHARHGERIYRFCFRLCGQAADAEDLAQDVLLAACQGAAGFGGRSSVATWLYRIALNLWRHRQTRGNPPTASWEQAEHMTAHQADPAHSVPGELALTQALSALPDDLRETFLLVKAEGLKYREAAEALGIPQGTVQWRVHEAAQRLRVLLQEEEDHDL